MSDTDIHRCAEDCFRCYAVCKETIFYCLRLQGEYVDEHRIRLLTRCAAVCKAGADLLVSAPEIGRDAIAWAAEACAECAGAVEWIPHDPQLAGCAAICRDCAATCAAFVTSRPSRARAA